MARRLPRAAPCSPKPRAPRRLSLLALPLLLTATLGMPAHAGTPPSRTLSASAPTVSWKGTLAIPDPLGCGATASLGCDETTLTVLAAKGTWITVSVDDPTGYLRVTQGATSVANGGQHASTGASTITPTVTFQQVSSGRVAYVVGVSDLAANPASPITYQATARLSGKAFDREGDCGASPGVEHVLDTDDGATLPLSVRLVADPKDKRAVIAAAKGLVEIYGRIDVAVRVSYDFTSIRPLRTDTHPYEVIRRRYHGLRPPGVDVVHVMTDLWAGGFADCIGGVAYSEKAFSVGSIHYTVEGVVPVIPPQPLVAPAALVAGHEIGHLLGAQHQQVNCIEPLVPQVTAPPSDGWVRPCSIMGPLAHVDSEIMSTAERTTVRSYVRRFAKG